MESIHRSGRIVLLFLLLSLVATASAATGTVQINVHPGGGMVCLGTVCKENPPTAENVGSITFEKIEAGQYYMVSIYNVPGYKPYLKQVYLDPVGLSLTRDITLEAIPATSPGTGSVQVYITPDGGRVCLDKMCELSSGDGTGSWSVQFTDVPANTYHTLTIAHAGYETYTSQVRLLPGQTSTMSITLPLLPPGSTAVPTPVPESTPATEPQPTRADLPGTVAFLATGLCWAALAMRRSKHA